MLPRDLLYSMGDRMPVAFNFSAIATKLIPAIFHLRAYVQSHEDLRIYDIYIDDGYSGANFERPEFERMMVDILNISVPQSALDTVSRHLLRNNSPC